MRAKELAAAAVFGAAVFAARMKGAHVSVVPVTKPAHTGTRVLFRGLVDGDSVGDFPSVESAKKSAERFLGVA